MKIFEVTRFGNDVDGSNGPDTNYLVYAHDHEEAAALVKKCEPKLNIISELGVCSGEVEQPVVLRGPYIQHAYSHGYNFPLWTWDAYYGLDVWMPMILCLNGVAMSHYANGQLAARCECWKGQHHGFLELWYPNGQLMHRAEHRNGNWVGVHEYWYADGTPASRHEYFKRGVQFKQWDRSGQLIKDEIEHWDC